MCKLCADIDALMACTYWLLSPTEEDETYATAIFWSTTSLSRSGLLGEELLTLAFVAGWKGPKAAEQNAIT